VEGCHPSPPPTAQMTWRTGTGLDLTCCIVFNCFHLSCKWVVTSHHDDVSDTESTDITEVLPVGYQVTNFLGALLWLSVGQDSPLLIQPVLHVIHIPDPSTPLRLDTYTPVALFRLTGFMGSPPITDTKLRYWEPTLIVTSDLPL
jgi:hypothetical protein